MLIGLILVEIIELEGECVEEKGGVDLGSTCLRSSILSLTLRKRLMAAQHFLSIFLFKFFVNEHIFPKYCPEG